MMESFTVKNSGSELFPSKISGWDLQQARSSEFNLKIFKKLLQIKAL